MAIILDSLKKTLDDIALFVLLRIKVMLNFEIGFIGDTSKGSMLGDEKANLPAGQYHIQKLHSLVEENMNLGVFTAARRPDCLLFPAR